VNLNSLLVYIEHNGDESPKDYNFHFKYLHKQVKQQSKRN